MSSYLRIGALSPEVLEEVAATPPAGKPATQAADKPRSFSSLAMNGIFVVIARSDSDAAISEGDSTTAPLAKPVRTTPMEIATLTMFARNEQCGAS